MANVSSINGFKPVKHLNGSPYNGQANLYYFDSGNGTAAYIGDPVKLSGTADPAYGDAPSVILAAANDAIVGIVVGFLVDPTKILDVSSTGRAASTNRYCWVADAPDLILEAETSNGTPGIADVGQNVNHAIGSPDATFAKSGATVDMGTKGTTATNTFKLVGFVPREGNDPAAASAKVWVKINNHQFDGGTGTLGV